MPLLANQFVIKDIKEYDLEGYELNNEIVQKIKDIALKYKQQIEETNQLEPYFLLKFKNLVNNLQYEIYKLDNFVVPINEITGRYQFEENIFTLIRDYNRLVTFLKFDLKYDNISSINKNYIDNKLSKIADSIELNKFSNYLQLGELPKIALDALADMIQNIKKKNYDIVSFDEDSELINKFKEKQEEKVVKEEDEEEERLRQEERLTQEEEERLRQEEEEVDKQDLLYLDELYNDTIDELNSLPESEKNSFLEKNIINIRKFYDDEYRNDVILSIDNILKNLEDLQLKLLSGKEKSKKIKEEKEIKERKKEEERIRQEEERIRQKEERLRQEEERLRQVEPAEPEEDEEKKEYIDDELEEISDNLSEDDVKVKDLKQHMIDRGLDKTKIKGLRSKQDILKVILELEREKIGKDYDEEKREEKKKTFKEELDRMTNDELKSYIKQNITDKGLSKLKNKKDLLEFILNNQFPQ